MKHKSRCRWAETNELFFAYHDMEWGVPMHDDERLFEMLNLEGAQAGLNWATILKKRAGYRKAFDGFDAKKIARYTQTKQAKLLQNPAIVRNQLKIQAVVENARAFLRVQKMWGSFDAFVWQITEGKTLIRPSQKRATQKSHEMSELFRAHGFRFVGPTIMYAFMQAIGMVDDHEKRCFRSKKEHQEH